MIVAIFEQAARSILSSFSIVLLFAALVMSTGIPGVSQSPPGPVPGKTLTPGPGSGFCQVFPGFARFEHILLVTTYVTTHIDLNQDGSRVALIFS